MRSIPPRLWALSVLSSLLQILPFPLAGPVPLWRRLFCWFCLTPLLLALVGNDKAGRPLRASQTALLAYVCGFFWYMGNCYWIYQTMHIYGDIPIAGAAGILLLFSLYVALYHALFGGLIGLLRKRFSVQTVLWVSPLVWVAVELARARVTGFPWDLLGYTQVDNLVVGHLAPWTGVFGLSAAVALVNVLWIARIGKGGGWSYAGPATAVMIVALLVGIRPSPPAAATGAQAVLVQENLSVGADSGPVESRDELLASFTGLSLHPLFPASVGGAATNPQLIAWPESPADFKDADPAFVQALGALALEAHAPVIANDVSLAPRDNEGHYHLYNSAIFFAADGKRLGRYDKMHLVPFGEYTPYKPLFFFAGHLLDNLPFVPGLQRSLFTADGKQYGVFICYESIFGDDIRRFVADGADVLVNISDDGWYGDSSAPWEHLDMVRMRAMENRRWVLRATNTGITAAIDPLGRITARMPRHMRGSMVASFGYSDEVTFYTRHGDWFAWICGMVTIVMLTLSLDVRRAVNYRRKRRFA